MIDWLEFLDQRIVLFINGLNKPFLDDVMWLISDKFVWFPFYLLLFIFVYIEVNLKSAILFTLVGFAAVGLADFTATFIFKEMIGRLRPSHSEAIGHLLHFYEFKPGEFYKGGRFGFVSGHATNSFVIAWLFSKRLQHTFKWITPLLLSWAIVVCFSRIYLGVHYLSDIIGGMILGTTIAFLFYRFYEKIDKIKHS